MVIARVIKYFMSLQVPFVTDHDRLVIYLPDFVHIRFNSFYIFLLLFPILLYQRGKRALVIEIGVTKISARVQIERAEKTQTRELINRVL